MKKLKQTRIKMFVLGFLLIVILVAVKYPRANRDHLVINSNSGPMLPIVSTMAHFDKGYNSVKVINNSGMSGKDGRTDSHSNNADSSWQFTARNKDDEVSIIFDLGQIQPLGEMWVWNYNVVNSDSGKAFYQRGLKNVRIFYSVNKKDWVEWKGKGYPFRLGEGNGSDHLMATNLNGSHDPIVFDGAPAQYVKISAETKPGEGNWDKKNGDRIFGLSQVRIYRYRTKVVENGQIIPISAKTVGKLTEITGPENTINNYGMYDHKIGLTTSHDTDEKAMWLASANKGDSVSLIYDLGGTYPLHSMEIWNYNGTNKETRGVKNVKVYYSIDEKNWTELRGNGYPYVLAKGNGKSLIRATNLNDGKHSPILFNGALAKFVKLVLEDNWEMDKGNQVFYGLSAVHFTASAGIAVEPVYEWDALFSRYKGWSGADGIYSIPLNGYDAPGKAKETKTLFLFGDTIIGTVNPITRQRIQSNILHNSLAILDGEEPLPSNMKWILNGNTADVNLFTPKTPNSPKDSWYWNQDGVVVGDKVYLFPLRMKNDLGGKTGFQFAIDGVSMISVPLSKDGPIIEKQKQFNTPLFSKLPDGSGNIVFGAGILDNTKTSGSTKPDGYIYVYGYKDLITGKKELVVSRVKPVHINQFALWEYWDGKKWSSEIKDVASLVSGVSPELSVTYMKDGPYKGKYLLVMEEDTLSGYIAVSQADSPQGPFSPIKTLYYSPEAIKGNGVITYNAKAHPNLSKPGELLITYNVNTTNQFENNIDADIYRPRWLKIREIQPK